MDAIFASSRGNTIADKLLKCHPDNLFIYVKPSAKLEELQHEAYHYLEHSPDPTNCHIYFVPGCVTLHTVL